MTSTQDAVGIELTKLTADDVIACDSISPDIYPETLHAQDEIHPDFCSIEINSKLYIQFATQCQYQQNNGLNASRTSPEGGLCCDHRSWAFWISSG
jgi:hypothetical protein